VVPQRRGYENNQPQTAEGDVKAFSAHGGLAHGRAQDREQPAQQSQADQGGADAQPEQVLRNGPRAHRRGGGGRAFAPARQHVLITHPNRLPRSSYSSGGAGRPRASAERPCPPGPRSGIRAGHNQALAGEGGEALQPEIEKGGYPAASTLDDRHEPAKRIQRHQHRPPSVRTRAQTRRTGVPSRNSPRSLYPGITNLLPNPPPGTLSATRLGPPRFPRAHAPRPGPRLGPVSLSHDTVMTAVTDLVI